MFDDDIFQLKEPSLVRWLTYFFAVDVLIKHFTVIAVELEGAWREHKDMAAKGAYHVAPLPWSSSEWFCAHSLQCPVASRCARIALCVCSLLITVVVFVVGFLDKLRSGEFLPTLCLIYDCCEVLNKFSRKLQSDNVGYKRSCLSHSLCRCVSLSLSLLLSHSPCVCVIFACVLW